MIHVEHSTGDLYYHMKEDNTYTTQLNDVLQDALNSIILRDLSTAKALWSEDFSVDYMKARLLKKVKRSEIFVVP